uniref:Cadherin domain-containing protein n=1 Tax=Knipowitschia caucasica TaxID=637954 RepID=A0AAV2JYN6_KNICA
MTWYGNCTVAEQESLQRVVKTAQRIIGAPLSALENIQSQRTLQRAQSSSTWCDDGGIYQFRVPESFKHGAAVGRVRATDRDIGPNAEMFFTIVSGDGMDVFQISTDKLSQEGVVTVNKPLDFERKQSYTVEVQVQNTQVDPRFTSAGSRDVATVRISVEDVDEPPHFDKTWYQLEVKEDAGVGAAVGAVSAVDPDGARSPVKYAIDRRTDLDRIFNVHPGNGSIFLLRPIDREDRAWHNISVIASELSE